MKSKLNICVDGTKEWKNYKRELHREDGPAVEYVDGDKCWYQHSQPHRIDGPAIDWQDLKEWYIDGKLHRIGGPAQEFDDGTKRWYKNDRLYIQTL